MWTRASCPTDFLHGPRAVLSGCYSKVHSAKSHSILFVRPLFFHLRNFSSLVTDERLTPENLLLKLPSTFVSTSWGTGWPGRRGLLEACSWEVIFKAWGRRFRAPWPWKSPLVYTEFQDAPFHTRPVREESIGPHFAAEETGSGYLL